MEGKRQTKHLGDYLRKSAAVYYNDRMSNDSEW